MLTKVQRPKTTKRFDKTKCLTWFPNKLKHLPQIRTKRQTASLEWLNTETAPNTHKGPRNQHNIPTQHNMTGSKALTVGVSLLEAQLGDLAGNGRSVGYRTKLRAANGVALWLWPGGNTIDMVAKTSRILSFSSSALLFSSLTYEIFYEMIHKPVLKCRAEPPYPPLSRRHGLTSVLWMYFL